MSLGTYTARSSRISLGWMDRDIIAAKVATAIRKGASIKEAASAHGISTTMVRNLAADYDFPLPSNKGDRNWPSKDEPGIYEPTAYEWARRNWERSVKAARETGVSNAYRRSWDRQPPAVFYDEYLPPQPKAATAAEVISQVCEKHRVSKDALTGQLRRKDFVKARQEAAFRMIVEVGLSYPQAGRLLGGRDHTTIIHAVRKHASSSPQAMAAYRAFHSSVETSSDELAATMIYEHFEEGVSVNQICKRHSVSRQRAMKVLLDESDRRRRIAA